MDTTNSEKGVGIMFTIIHVTAIVSFMRNFSGECCSPYIIPVVSRVGFCSLILYLILCQLSEVAKMLPARDSHPVCVTEKYKPI
jgi:hypothetical protein